MTRTLVVDIPRDAVTAHFTVPGEPVSKARARFTHRGSKTFAFTPEKTRAAETAVAAAYRAAGGKLDPDVGATYGVKAIFSNGTRQRRDIDNMLKLILDGLNRVAWQDDNQVVEVSARKHYTPTRSDAKTEVWVYRVDSERAKTAVCEECSKVYATYDSWVAAGRRFCSRDCSSAESRRARQRTCVTCGVEFLAGNRRAAALYCSRQCHSADGRLKVSCDECGQSFERQRCHVKVRNYCSGPCVAAAHRRSARSRPAGTCESCGGPVTKKQYKRCRACRQANPAGVVS